MERAYHPDKRAWYVSFDGERWFPASEKPTLSNLEKMRAEVAGGRAEYVRCFWTQRGIEIVPVIARRGQDEAKPMSEGIIVDERPHRIIDGISDETRRYIEDLLGS
jgi:hypothetical protein